MKQVLSQFIDEVQVAYVFYQREKLRIKPYSDSEKFFILDHTQHDLSTGDPSWFWEEL